MALRLFDFSPIRPRACLCAILPSLLVVLVLACGDAPGSKPRGSTPEAVIKNYRFTLCDTGQQKMRVTAREMRMPEDQSVARLKDVRIVQLQDGVASGTMTAREGLYYLKDSKDGKHKMQDLDLNGSVVVAYPSKGFSLKSDHAVIAGVEKKLISDYGTVFRVQMEDQSLRGNAEHFEMNLLEGFDTLTFRLKTKDKRSHMIIGDVPPKAASPITQPKGQKR